MLKALVIDDNSEMADSLCKMLSLLDISAESAYGARSGMLALSKNKPDVVFLDINMPGLTGFDVFEYFKQIPGFAKTPVIIVTSDDQPETAQRVKQMGAVTLIVKPATLDDLETALQKARLLA